MSVRNRILGPPVPKMPSGLIELMDGLARDVLKNNPENIYEFCAHHMQTLLEIRDGRASRPVMTLDQKIEKAQKKIRQRAEQRQHAYDKKLTDEITNKERVLPEANTPYCSDGLESSEKKQIETASIVSQPEEKDPTNIEDQRVPDKPAVINEVDVEKLEKEKENDDKSKQEIPSDLGSDKIEKTVLLISDLEPREITKHDEIIESIENDLTQESQCLDITSDKTKADNNVSDLQEEAVINVQCNDKTEEEIIPMEHNDIDLANSGADILQNNDGNEDRTEVEIHIKNENDDIQSICTIEKAPLPSDENPKENSYIGTDLKQFESEIDELVTNTSVDDKGTEITLNTGTKEKIIDEQTKDLNEPDKSEDDKILTVILDSNSTEIDSLETSGVEDNIQPMELNPVQIIVPETIPHEFDQKSEQVVASNVVPENIQDDNKANGMNSSMDLETAAITIQKVFRSFLFKTKTASYDDPTPVDITLLTEDKEKEENEVLNIKDRRPLGISRMDTVLQTVNEEKSLSLSTDDSSTLSSAATIIQAHVRGFLVRNKLNLNKTISSNSFMDSDAPSIPSLEADSENTKGKTVLNIHIVPEGSHFVSRDESFLTSMDLPLDCSPQSSVNLHPLGYDKSERRKQLKREDAIQSVSPPSNNSGKLSEEHDSVKEVLTVESNTEISQVNSTEQSSPNAQDTLEKTGTKVTTESDSNIENLATDTATDEMDVITPFLEERSSRASDRSTKLLHSGEFHDIVVPTSVMRSDTSVVREFQNVLVYFILWNN